MILYEQTENLEDLIRRLNTELYLYSFSVPDFMLLNFLELIELKSGVDTRYLSLEVKGVKR